MGKKYSGVWLYGLSGSGKTFVSNFLKTEIPKSVVIDGDKVRKLISFDLGYSIKDREIQIRRVYGLCKLIIDSKKFPIASTVYFNRKLYNYCIKSKILPIKIERENFKKIKKMHKTYKNKLNVVGKDIYYEKFKVIKIVNDNSKKFLKKFKKFNFYS